MSDLPIIERIAEAIEARLATIAIANGYKTDVADVARPTRPDLQDVRFQDYLVVLLQGDSAAAPEDDSPQMRATRIQDFAVACVARPSEKSLTAVDRLLNVFAADVVNCAMTDPTWTAGGEALAIDTWIASIERVPMTDEAATVDIVHLEVLYRTSVTDMYELA